MVTVLNFKNIVDLPKWRALAPALNPFVTGVPLICDLRNNDDRHPKIYAWISSNVFNEYNVKSDDWSIPPLAGATAGSVAAGSTAVFMPCQGPRGTVGASPDTSTIVISTPFANTVSANELANRGDGRGYKIRIIGNSGGSSGKVEERIIVANTGTGIGTTTPTITLDSPLSFTPLNGDHYEFLSGRIFILTAGTTASGSWRYTDIATQIGSGTLSIINLPSAIGPGESYLYALDELYVPYNRNPGEGFLGVLIAQATTNGVLPGTLTGQAVGGDASVVTNEYRNFQIRIVQDTVTPTAAGQRQIIASHTAGPSPVYTLYTPWTVQPSNNAQYVIEYTGDRILLWFSGFVGTWTYTISTDTWDTTTFATLGPALTIPAAVIMPSFAIVPDSTKNARQSFIYVLRGTGAPPNFIQLMDIAGGATGAFTTSIRYGGGGAATTTGTTAVYEPVTNQGRYTYINVAGTQRFLRFDALNRNLEESTFLRVPITQVVPLTGIRMASHHFQDGNTKLAFIIHGHPSDTSVHQLTVSR